jgi:hypothetical protein
MEDSDSECFELPRARVAGAEVAGINGKRLQETPTISARVAPKGPTGIRDDGPSCLRTDRSNGGGISHTDYVAAREGGVP